MLDGVALIALGMAVFCVFWVLRKARTPDPGETAASDDIQIAAFATAVLLVLIAAGTAVVGR